MASLAVADLTLGLVVMPFSLAQEVMGYWVFGEPWCQGRTEINLPRIMCMLASSLALALTLVRLTRQVMATPLFNDPMRVPVSGGVIIYPHGMGMMSSVRQI